MGEARMAQRMGAQREQPRFRHPNVVLAADRTIVPCAKGTETVPVVLAVFPDHGRPAFVGSTIKSRQEFIQAASALTEGESLRLDGALIRILEQVLDEGIVRSSGVFKSDREGKPDLHVASVGDTFSGSSLRLYFHIGQHEVIDRRGKRINATVLFQDARVRKSGAWEVEKPFMREGGYVPPKEWDARKGAGRA